MDTQQFLTPTNDLIHRWIIDWISARRTGISCEIRLNQSLTEFAFDSIAAIELAADLQKLDG